VKLSARRKCWTWNACSTKIVDSKGAFKPQKSAFSEEVSVKSAGAQLAYELQGGPEQPKTGEEEIEIEGHAA
jgi:hypothetical protein